MVPPSLLPFTFSDSLADQSRADPFEKTTFQGPQVSQVQYDRIMQYVKEGKDQGANVLTGGQRHGDKGYFIQPTIFTDAPADSKIVKEEIFGPVVVVNKFKDEADLLKVANDSVYGLAAAVFTRDISRGHRVAHELKAGTVWVNCYNVYVLARLVAGSQADEELIRLLLAPQPAPRCSIRWLQAERYRQRAWCRGAAQLRKHQDCQHQPGG